MKEKNVDKLIKEYIAKQNLYREFSLAVRAILEQLLVDSKFQFISSREKDPLKLREKVLRKKKEKSTAYGKLGDIEDLAGVRIVFYLESQKHAFVELLKKEIGEGNLSFEERYKAGGYRATHCIFSLDKDRSNLSEYRRFKGLKCEIQMTSSLYHAWSEIEHDIIYKPGVNKKSLNELGLKELKKSFEETMIKHIVVASHQFENLYTEYKNKVEGAKIFGDIYNIQSILSSSTNDDIYSKLEIIGNFPDKKSEEIIAIIQAVLTKKPKRAIPIGSFGGGSIFGKTHKDIVLKCVELIKGVRYFSTEKALFILVDLIKSPDKEIKEKSVDALKAVATFNYHLLTKSKAGYSYQSFVLDFMKRWSVDDSLSNIDFVLTVSKELLSSSVEGSSWTDEKTLTMNFAQVESTDFLKKMRRETMDFVYDLYVRIQDSKIRLQLSSVLEEVLRGQSNVAYSDSLKEMLDEDAKYLAKIYRKMIFDKFGNLIRENIAVVEEIEERFYYFAKPEKGRPSDLVKLREDILSDSFYKKVCPMIGGRAAYRGEEGYEESRKRRENDQRSTIVQISEENLAEWMEILDILAKQKNVIEEWKLGDLKRFFELLSIEKPDITDRLLETAFKKKCALAKFSENFLIGFHVASRFDLWDKYVELIAKKHEVYLTGGICNSLLGYTQDQLPRKLRLNEMSILEEIVYKTKRFAFLKTKKKDANLWYLHDRLFHVLAFNSKPQQREMELLIKEEMEKNPEYAQVHYNGLQFVATVWKWLDLSLASKTFKKFLLKKIVEAPDMDWHLQEFLIAICNKDFHCIMGIFEKRITRYVTLQKNDKSRGMKRMLKRKEFEAIPHHFNPDLQGLLKNDRDFSRVMQAWIRRMTLGWSIYNWEVSRFLEDVKADKRRVLSDIVTNGDDKDFLRVVYAIEGINKVDFELCMQIVGRTDNERIKRKIRSIMYATGVVSGEYGIADAYKGKAEMLQKYKSSKNNRIKKFSTEMIGYLQKSEEEERKRTDENIQLRKMEFEG